MRDLRGFTLLEMLVVVAIMGIAVAIAVPNMKPAIDKSLVTRQAERVASFVEDARGRARANRRCHSITLAGNTLSIGQKNIADCTTAFTTGDFTTVKTLTLQASLGVTIQSTGPAADTIVFMSSGRLYGDGDLVFDEDAARIVVEHTGSNKTAVWEKAVNITPRGRICVSNHVGGAGALPAGVLSCPSGNNALGHVPFGWSALAALLGLGLLGARRKQTRRKRPRRSRRMRRAPRGYILLEVLIAAALISVTLAAVLQALATARKDVSLASNRIAAVQHAHGKLDELLSTPQTTIASQNDTPELNITRTWVVAQSGLDTQMNPALNDSPASIVAADILHEITVTVTYQWTEDQARTYTISALKRAPQ